MQQPQHRDPVWDGCLNVRDLGGLPTSDRGETRFGPIVRADCVRQLSDEGWRALVDHGIRTVIDLRGETEFADDPPTDLPVEVVNVPFLSGNQTERDVLEAAAAAAPDVSTSTRDVYLIFLERFRANVASAARAIASAPQGGVVIHCVGGKGPDGVAFSLPASPRGCRRRDDRDRLRGE